MARGEVDPFAARSVAGAIAFVPQLCKPSCDGHKATEDAFHFLSTVRPRASRPRSQRKRLLGLTDKGGQVCPVVHLSPKLKQHGLSGAFE
jgi:hypothetical protein